MILTNSGPGIIDKIFVNGKVKWTNVKFEKSCVITVGEKIEIDGKLFYKAGKGDNFCCGTISGTKSLNNFF